MTPEQIAYALTHTPHQFAFLQALLALAPLIGSLAGKISGNRANARVAETGLNNQQDTLAINRSQIERDARLAEQGNATQNALRAGLKDYSVSRPDGVPSGHAMGGLRPSSISGLNSLGTQFENDSLARLLAGTTPELTPVPKAGKLDKLLNIINFAGGAAGLYNQFKNPAIRPTTTMAAPEYPE